MGDPTSVCDSNWPNTFSCAKAGKLPDESRADIVTTARRQGLVFIIECYFTLSLFAVKIQSLQISRSLKLLPKGLRGKSPLADLVVVGERKWSNATLRIPDYRRRNDR